MKSSAVGAYLTHRPSSQGLKRHRWGESGRNERSLFSDANFSKWYLSALRDYHPHNCTPRFHLAPHILVLFRSAPNISAATAKTSGSRLKYFDFKEQRRMEMFNFTERQERGWRLIPPFQSKNSSNKLFESRKIMLTIFSSLEQRPLRPMQLNKFDQNV